MKPSTPCLRTSLWLPIDTKKEPESFKLSDHQSLTTLPRHSVPVSFLVHIRDSPPGYSIPSTLSTLIFLGLDSQGTVLELGRLSAWKSFPRYPQGFLSHFLKFSLKCPLKQVPPWLVHGELHPFHRHNLGALLSIWHLSPSNMPSCFLLVSLFCILIPTTKM